MSAVAGITFFPCFLTVTVVPTIACVHIAISITVGDFVPAAACFHASDGVPAVDRVHDVASSPTLLSSLLILAYAPTFTGHCEL
jgi:hypothetical protein